MAKYNSVLLFIEKNDVPKHFAPKTNNLELIFNKYFNYSLYVYVGLILMHETWFVDVFQAFYEIFYFDKN